MNSPRVTIAIPAYKAEFLDEALQSAFRQDFAGSIEILLCDDCPTEAVAEVVRPYLDRPGFRYLRNREPLLEIGNFTQCLREARGHYLKFLCDDDLLAPDAIRRMAEVLDAQPDITLVASRRGLIDQHGREMRAMAASQFPFRGDTCVHGPDLVSFFSDRILNFIGEPSTVLFRREQLLPHADALFSFGGQRIHWLADLVMHVHLLRQGHLAMLEQTLSLFRISDQQVSHTGRTVAGIGSDGYRNFRRMIRELGWYRAGEDNGQVRTAPLQLPHVFAPLDLGARVDRMLRGLAPFQSLEDWLETRLPSQPDARLIDARLAAHDGGPSIEIFVRDLSGDTEALLRTLQSLEFGQCLYGRLHITVLTASTGLEALAGDRVAVVRTDAADAVAALNLHIVQAPAPWFVLVDAGEQFTRAGLLQAALRLIDEPDCRLLYCDEMRRLPDGSVGAAFRPDFNLDLLLSFPASMARHVLVNREAFLQAGGFDPALGDALELDLALRLVEAGGFAGLSHLAEPLLSCPTPALQDLPQERQAILAHLQRRGYAHAQVLPTQPGRYRVLYGHADQPLVSLVIPTRDQLPVLQRCIESLLERTGYPAYEVLIVDNGSSAPDAVMWLDGIAAMNSEQLRVLRYPLPFNYSAMNNLAAREARGEYLVLLNNDTAIVKEDWLEALLNHALRPEVGVVGAKLLYPSGTIQHAGVVLGLRGPADHPFMQQPMDAPGYMQRLEVDQDYSAVTAACLMVRKSVYDEVEGLDEEAFKVSYNDVDLCLKVRASGHLVVWTPHAVLMHEGSVSQARVDTAAAQQKQDRFRSEQEALYERWLPLLARDPAYNEVLMLEGPGFELETRAEFAWRPLAWRPLPVVRAQVADVSGSAHQRVLHPLAALREAGLVQGVPGTHHLPPVYLERQAPDAIVLQHQPGERQIEGMRRARRYSRAFLVYELDACPPGHAADLPDSLLRQAVACADRLVVATDALAETFAGLHADTRVVKTRLAPRWWDGLQPRRRAGAKPRVGWVSETGHPGDLEPLVEAVRALAGQVEWVVLGICPEFLRPWIDEVRPGVVAERHPAALASLDLDLALAPLEDTLANACGSHQRLLEYGACAYPVICSDLRCHQEPTLPVTRVRNRPADWLEAIRMHLDDLDAAARAGDALRSAVLRHWMLQGSALEDWRAAWLG